jgi:hypothetical protein
MSIPTAALLRSSIDAAYAARVSIGLVNRSPACGGGPSHRLWTDEEERETIGQTAASPWCAEHGERASAF